MSSVISRVNGIEIHLNSRTGGLLRNFATQGGNELIFQPPRGVPTRPAPDMKIGSPAEDALNQKAAELEAFEQKLKEQEQAAAKVQEELDKKAAELEAQRQALSQEAAAKGDQSTETQTKPAAKTTRAAAKTTGAKAKATDPTITDLA